MELFHEFQPSRVLTNKLMYIDYSIVSVNMAG